MNPSAIHRALLRRRPRPRLALVLGPEDVTAIELRPSLRGPVPRRMIARPLAARDGEGWPDLDAALREIREELGIDDARVDVALLPPLVQSKVLLLPAVRERELHPLVLRNARRYFVLPDTGPLVLDAVRLGRPRRGGPAPTLVSCGAEAVVRCAAAAISGAGLLPGAVAAAPLAGLRAALARLPLLRRGRAALLIASPGRAELVLLEGGKPTLLQQAAPRDVVRWAAEGLRRAAEAGISVERAVVCAGGRTAEVRERLAALLGVDAPELPAAPGVDGLSPELLFALGVASPGRDTPLLRLGEQRRAAQRREAVRAAALAGVSALILSAAAGVHLWGLRQELAAVREQRRELAGVVETVREARQRIVDVRGALVALDELEATSARWTMEIRALAETLPETAYLSSVRVDGRQLHLSGFGSSASSVVPALEGSARFAGVGLSAPVRREPSQGRETFDMVLTLDSLPQEPTVPGPKGAPR